MVDSYMLIHPPRSIPDPHASPAFQATSYLVDDLSGDAGDAVSFLSGDADDDWIDAYGDAVPAPLPSPPYGHREYSQLRTQVTTSPAFQSQSRPSRSGSRAAVKLKRLLVKVCTGS